MSKKRKYTFITPEETKNIQDSMKDHGRASTYWGLIVVGFIVVAILLNYFFGIK